MNDPTFGCTPGREIDNKTKYFTNCKRCKESVLMGQVQDVYRQIKWKKFEAKPVEHNGQNYYRAHRCEGPA